MKCNDIQTDIVIIGAGAAGMMAALSAVSQGKCVVLVEHTDRVGHKILSTGNGKCNLGHIGLSSEDFFGTGKGMVDGALERFGTEDTILFFRNLGVYIRNKDEYLYPYSEMASSVLDALRFACERNENIKIYTGQTIDNILFDEDESIYIAKGDGFSIKTMRIIIACGGMAAPKTGSDGSGYELAKILGHNIIEPVPSLVKLKSTSGYCKMLDGVRAKGTLKLIIDNKDTGITEKGEIQFIKDGISGIPVFNISRHISYALKNDSKVRVIVNLLPDFDPQELIETYYARKNNCSGMTAEEFFTGLINKKIMLAAFKMSKISASEKVENIDINQIGEYISSLRMINFDISGTYGFEFAQVTAGGVDCSEIDRNFQSQKAFGVYFAGEILDVDGICGGYNLQWAWTSGHIAGEMAARSIVV